MDKIYFYLLMTPEALVASMLSPAAFGVRLFQKMRVPYVAGRIVVGILFGSLRREGLWRRL